MTVDETRGWSESNLSWMSMWARQISFTQEAYIRAARFWQRVYYALCIVALSFTALSGLTQVPTIGSCPIGSVIACTTLQWFGVFCAAVATLVGAVNNLLGANSKATQCRETADSLRKLASDVDLVVRCDADRRPEQLGYSQLVLERYNAILDKAPTLLRRHSLESTALPNRTLLGIYVQNAENMHELQELHIHSAPAVLAAEQQPPTEPLQSSPSLPPLLPSARRPTLVINSEDTRLMRTLQDQLKRLDEHADDRKHAVKH